MVEANEGEEEEDAVDDLEPDEDVEVEDDAEGDRLQAYLKCKDADVEKHEKFICDLIDMFNMPPLPGQEQRPPPAVLAVGEEDKDWKNLRKSELLMMGMDLDVIESHASQEFDSLDTQSIKKRLAKLNEEATAE